MAARGRLHRIAEAVGRDLGAIRDSHPGWFTGIRQIFSTLDPRVLQFKPGLPMAPELVDELLGRMADGIARAERRAADDGGPA